MEWKLEYNCSMQTCMLLSLSASSFHSAKLNELTYFCPKNRSTWLWEKSRCPIRLTGTPDYVRDNWKRL